MSGVARRAVSRRPQRHLAYPSTASGRLSTWHDPGEQADLLPARPDAAAPLRRALAAWREECGSLAAHFGPRDAGTAPDPATMRQLRALGYVQ